jgi:hypothetical protein
MMENIADAVLEEGLATRAEIDEVVRELYEFAADQSTVAGGRESFKRGAAVPPRNAPSS